MTSATLTKVKSLIHPTDRIIMAKKDILPTKFPVSQHLGGFGPIGKPKGLWYAIGTEWIDWVEIEMPHWMGNKFYKIEITNKVLKIDDARKFLEFVKEFSAPLGYLIGPKDAMIDWLKVSEQYAGIEISPYQYKFSFEYMWYRGWDVASGCVWDKSGIRAIERMPIRKSTKTLPDSS